MGLTLACFQSDGTQPVVIDFWHISCREGAIVEARCFSTLGCRLSGPMDLCGFRSRSSFFMPSVDISMSSMFGYCFLFLHQEWSEKSVGLFLVKTELNWALRISAFSLGESFSTPFSFKGDISTESGFLCLMKFQSFLL